MSSTDSGHVPPAATHNANAKSDKSYKSDKVPKPRILAAYKQMLMSFFIATIIVIGVLIVLIFPFFYSYYVKSDPNTHDPPLLFVVLLAGSLGALFSALMRLYNFEDLPKALVTQELEGLPTRHLVIYSLVPPVVGAISATVIYMLFAGGLVQGDLFPLFKCKNTEKICTTFGKLIGDWGPDEAKDYAKSIVWGFIAGFAERLVPDTLQTLSKSAQNTQDQGRAEKVEHTAKPT